LGAERRWVYSNPEAAGTAEAAGAAPLLYSHMGMLQVLPNGTLAAAWQARRAAARPTAPSA